MLLLSFFISFLFLLCRVIVRLIFFLKVNEELSARTKVEKNYQISKFQSQFAIVKERTVRRGLYKLSNELSPAHCSQLFNMRMFPSWAVVNGFPKGVLHNLFFINCLYFICCMRIFYCLATFFVYLFAILANRQCKMRRQVSCRRK